MRLGLAPPARQAPLNRKVLAIVCTARSARSANRVILDSIARLLCNCWWRMQVSPTGTYKIDVGAWDSKCAICLPCAPGHTRVGCGGVSAGKCLRCSSGTYKTSIGAWNTKCSPCKDCSAGSERSLCGFVLPGVCTPCIPGFTFKKGDRCVAATSCKSDEYESTAPTRTSNRCFKVSPKCSFPKTYEARAPTKTSDRVCLSIDACRTLNGC